MRKTLICIHWLSISAYGFVLNPSLSRTRSDVKSQPLEICASHDPSENIDEPRVQVPVDIDIIERLDLDSKFGRWKFMLDTMDEDGEVDPQDVNEILYKVLKSFYDNPRPEFTEDGKTNPSAILTEDQRELLVEDLFRIENSVGVISVMPMEDEEFTDEYTRILDLLEKLQPDPIEDEDDFRSCWDIVLEMYGREATKHAQQTGDVQFEFRSSIVRLLLHYEFLTDGIGE